MHEQAAAAEVAEAVRRAGGRTWRKVTTLLSMFGVHRLTPAVRERMSRALAAEGVVVSPPLDGVKRYETVRLSLAVAAPEAEAPAPEPAIANSSATSWRPGRPSEKLASGAKRPRGAVLWIDVPPTAEAEETCAALAPLCPGLTKEAVESLLRGGEYPHVRPLAPDWSIRAVSIVDVHALEPGDGDDAATSSAGALEFQLVDFVAGDGWLLSCSHRRRRFRGAHEIGDDEPRSLRLRPRIEDRWLNEGGKTAGDLGTLILHQIACDYTDARRHFHAWLESWELEFFRGAGDGAAAYEVATLAELRGLVAAFSKRLRALRLPRAFENRGWFPDVTLTERAASVDELIDRALDDLDRVNAAVRSSFDLVQSQVSRHQLQLAQRQNEVSKRLQDKITLITSVLLVPGLIASVYGANTWIPGEHKTHGFAAMLLVLVLAGAVTYAILRLLERRAERTLAEDEA
jgi:hypothetical protein